MNNRNFMEMLKYRWACDKFVCVGLDSNFDRIPESMHRLDGDHSIHESKTIIAFNSAIVEATKDLVCAYKPNVAFYEAYGAEGIEALRRTIENIRAIAPDVPVILDAKDADIDNTNEGYVEFAFEYLRADAITVHPYLGREALKSFLARWDKGIIVLCRTSNSGAGEFQDLFIPLKEELDRAENFLGREIHAGGWPLYQHVAYRVASEWNKNGNCALVVGATYPDELREVRKIVGDMPILIPGVGFQQKNVPLEWQVEQVVNAGKDGHKQGIIVNSSRGIIFASEGADFAQASRRKTEELHNFINQYRYPLSVRQKRG